MRHVFVILSCAFLASACSRDRPPPVQIGPTPQQEEAITKLVRAVEAQNFGGILEAASLVESCNASRWCSAKVRGPLFTQGLKHREKKESWERHMKVAAERGVEDAAEKAREEEMGKLEKERQDLSRAVKYAEILTGEIPGHASSMIPAFIKDLGNDDDNIKICACRALARLGRSAEKSADDLKKVADAGNPRVSEEAKKALKAIEP